MPKRILALLLLVVTVGLAGCASNDTSSGRFKVGKPYTIGGRTYYPEENYTHTETGIASWYGPGFHGRKTANGERFDENELTAAHRTLQMPSLVRVTNLENGNSVVVRVTDRGPFHGNRVIDVSKKAADLLGFRGNGTAKVKLQVLGPESMALAEAARRKISTKGAEVAVNNTGQLDERFAAFYPGMAPLQKQPEGKIAADVMVAEAENAAVPYEPASNIERVVAGELVPPQEITPAAGYPGDETARVPVPPRKVMAQGYEAQPRPPSDVADTAPYPPMTPPERQATATYEGARIRPRGLSSSRHAGIPVATLQPSDLAPRAPAYTQEPKVQVVPVSPTQIYVQAGSFTSQGNAAEVQKQVSSIGPARVHTANIGGQPYYRVRIGPIESVEKADAVVNTLQRQGRQATIIVTEN